MDTLSCIHGVQMKLVVGLCIELRSCPIFLLFSSCILCDFSSWKGHLLNQEYNNKEKCSNPSISLFSVHQYCFPCLHNIVLSWRTLARVLALFCIAYKPDIKLNYVAIGMLPKPSLLPCKNSSRAFHAIEWHFLTGRTDPRAPFVLGLRATCVCVACGSAC